MPVPYADACMQVAERATAFVASGAEHSVAPAREPVPVGA